MPQDAVLDCSDSRSVTLKAGLQIGARQLGDGRAEIPYLVGHGYGFRRYRNWAAFRHSSKRIIQFVLLSQWRAFVKVASLHPVSAPLMQQIEAMAVVNRSTSGRSGYCVS
jgi:hypothetical protein